MKKPEVKIPGKVEKEALMKISETEREEVKRMYFEQGMTRKDIASAKDYRNAM